MATTTATLRAVMRLNVQNMAGASLALEVPGTTTMAEVKTLIASEGARRNFPPAADQTLLVDGQRLDDATLAGALPPTFSVMFVVNTGASERAVAAQAAANRADAQQQQQQQQLAAAETAEPAGAAEPAEPAANVHAAADTGAPAPRNVPTATAAAVAPPAGDATAAAPAAGDAAVAADGGGGIGDGVGGVPAGGAVAAAGRGGAGAAPAATVPGPMMDLHFHTLSGRVKLLSVPMHATFGHIKAHYLAKPDALDTPARSMTLLYCGHELDDESTPFTQGCLFSSRMHVVRKVTGALLREVVAEADLVGNCRFCQTAGTKFVFRPQCRTCGSQTILDVTKEVVPGVTLWGDLGGGTCMCFACAGAAEEGEFPQPVQRELAFGVFCDNRKIPGAVTCPTRQLKTDEDRQLFRERLTVCTGDNAVEVASELYGYAHGGGLTCC